MRPLFYIPRPFDIAGLIFSRDILVFVFEEGIPLASTLGVIRRSAACEKKYAVFWAVPMIQENCR